MDTAELLRRVRRIEIKTKRRSQDLISGAYHSTFKGRGMSFEEVRAYQFGDDVRHIDWNVTARSGTPHIKVFSEERELTIWLLIDASASMKFGSQRSTKQELVAELAAILAFSASQNQDRVGALLFTDQVEAVIPPQKGRKAVLRIIRDILQTEGKAKATNLAAALTYCNNLIRKQAVVFVLSDFMSPDWQAPLQVMAQRHDLIGIEVCDPLELALPAKGLIRIQDPETGQTSWVDGQNKGYRQQHQHKTETTREGYRHNWQRLGGDWLSLRTDQDYLPDLLGFFRQRNLR